MLSGITGTFAKAPKGAAIPEHKVRYPCITHPFATNLASVTFHKVRSTCMP